jgi:galactonate dehydratase
VRISAVRTRLIDKFLFVEVETDNGLVGLGESGAWGYLEASGKAVELFGEYLLGEDPLRIEHHWQYMYRSTHFRGAAIMGAISAIDVALWDIAGQYYQAPVYQLLGGKCRDKARVYYHVKAPTKEEQIEKCLAAQKAGYTAVGHLNPFLDEPYETPIARGHASKLKHAAETVREIREAVGDEMDLCLELHRRLTPAEAVAFAGSIEEYRPMFYEDPVRPDNIDVMGEVADKIRLPIATGERLHTIYEFEMLLKRNAVQFVRPNICLAGGFTQVKKIAALAEARYVGFVAHNPQNMAPVSTAVATQLAGAVPNFAIQEYPADEARPGKADIVDNLPVVRDGFLIVPDAPGIGIKLLPDAEKKHPFQRRGVKSQLHVDGSVLDR